MEVTADKFIEETSSRQITLRGKGTFPLELYREDTPIRAVLSYAKNSEIDFIAKTATSFLHPNENHYYQTLQSSYRKYSFLLGRYTGKMALSHYLDEPRQMDIEIAHGIFSQPLVKYASLDIIPEITLSHTSSIAVAIAYEPGYIMGVDVEKLEPSKFSIFKDQMTEAEIGLSKCFLNIECGVIWNLLWTMKEALSKAIKCGLTVPFELLEIQRLSQDPSARFEASFKNFTQYRCYSWILPGFALSIVLPRNTSLRLDLDTSFRGPATAA